MVFSSASSVRFQVIPDDDRMLIWVFTDLGKKNGYRIDFRNTAIYFDKVINNAISNIGHVSLIK